MGADSVLGKGVDHVANDVACVRLSSLSSRDREIFSRQSIRALLSIEQRTELIPLRRYSSRVDAVEPRHMGRATYLMHALRSERNVDVAVVLRMLLLLSINLRRIYTAVLLSAAPPGIPATEEISKTLHCQSVVAEFLPRSVAFLRAPKRHVAEGFACELKAHRHLHKCTLPWRSIIGSPLLPFALSK